MANDTRLPEWLKTNHLDFGEILEMRNLIRGLHLNTICDSAQCPNRPECYSQGTATFLILGNICTRNCTFCAVTKGTPAAPDPIEPENIVKAIGKLGLRYVVITSVTRDDLPDGGASQFAEALDMIYKHNSDVIVEVLIPDFKASFPALQTVIRSFPFVLGHNLETVPRLYFEVRPKADYQNSLAILKQAKYITAKLITKSGLMLGLGESKAEVISVMNDLVETGCDVLTLGQYLQPSPTHRPVTTFVPPGDFEEYIHIGKQMGFRQVLSSPSVRSSFKAMETYYRLS